MFRTSALLVSSLGMALTGCKNNQIGQPAPIVDGNAAANDPAAANMIGTQVAGVSYAQMPQSSATNYAPQTAAPVARARGQNEAYQYNTQPPAYQGQQGYDQAYTGDQQDYYAGDPQSDANEYDQYAQLLDPGEGATQPPPPLPADYEQPEAPGPDYLWTPGYWDYANTGYYYVPGTWVSAPYQGALWTPGWWGQVGNRYRFHHGYWGRHVGYYGGINYGFGYIGLGYQGGYWNGDHFFYNREVNRVDPRRVNNYVYNRNISVTNREYINNTRVSYYGPGGLNRRPVPQEFAALREQRVPPMQAQLQNRRAAEANRQQFFAANNGRPATLFAARPLQADRNIAAPSRTMPANFGNFGRQGMPNMQMPANASPQQRQQFEQQQRMQQQQANVQQMQQRNMMEQQRNQNLQQHGQNIQQQQANAQQRQQFEQQQRMQQQQANVQGLQQRQQMEQQRNQNLQQRGQNMQQLQQNLQQRQQVDQQRQQLEQQRQQANVQQQQRQQQTQQFNQQRQQQQQQMNQQREQQANVQRQQQEQQRQQQANVQRQQQANQQRQQMNQQREQQVNQQRQQQVQAQQQQRTQQMQQQQAQQQQRVQQMQQQQQQRVQQQQQRVQEQQQRQQQMQARPAGAAPRMEAPRQGPSPHGEGPHGDRH
ncbi:YXWGXW repeat-containing protein [Terriglobus roseus]|nr:YXWGXW repeat-containing protein [Terriglobus roseus]